MAIIIFKRCPLALLENLSAFLYFDNNEHKKLTLTTLFQALSSQGVTIYVRPDTCILHGSLFIFLRLNSPEFYLYSLTNLSYLNLPVTSQTLCIPPYRLSHKLYIMQDNYIVYYSLQFSCLIAS